MLRLTARASIKNNKNLKNLYTTLVLTEEFPHSIPVSSKAPKSCTVQESTLENGMKIISYDNESGCASFKVSIKSGSRAEGLSIKGASKLLAYGALSGTKLRSGLRLCRDMEDMGVYFTSSANREVISLEVTALVDKAERAIAALAEIVGAPRNVSYLIDEIKPAFEEAFEADMADPQNKIMEMLHEASYGEGSPLGSSMFPASVKKLSANEIVAFRKSRFTASNIVVSSTGIPHDTVKKVVQYYFNAMPKTGDSTSPDSPYVGGDVRVRADLGGKTYLGLAFPIASGHTEACSVLVALLNSKLAAKNYAKSSASPLVSRCDTKVLSTSLTAKLQADITGGEVEAFVSPYSSGGIFGFVVKGSAASCGEVLQNALEELKAVASGATSAAEINAATNKVFLEKLLALESGGPQATEMLTSSAITGSSFSSSCLALKNMKSAEVVTAASAALKSTPSYAVLGATLGVPTYPLVVQMLN